MSLDHFLLRIVTIYNSLLRDRLINGGTAIAKIVQKIGSRVGARFALGGVLSGVLVVWAIA